MHCFTAALAGALLIGWTLPALAHAHPHETVPAANATVPTPPKAVSLTFDEDLQPTMSRVEVKEDGHVVSVGKGTADAKNARLLSVPLAKAHAGKYTVTWHALATDGHASSGSYTFTVKAGHVMTPGMKMDPAMHMEHAMPSPTP